MDKKNLTIALAGNPNSGKTTIFNALTGSRQHIGNYPGVTVEKKEGICEYKGYKINFVDLPGTYSLTAYSTEEVVARDFIVDEHPDVVVDIVDASNFERNLYLATQLLELNVPLVIALNMVDMASKSGYSFDCDKIGDCYNGEVVPTVGSKRRGITELLDAIIKIAESERQPPAHTIHYGNDIEREIDKLLPFTDRHEKMAKKYGRRWLCLKLLEEDKEIIQKIEDKQLLSNTRESIKHLEKLYGDTPEVLIAEKRYGYISGVYELAVRHTPQQRHQLSDMVDKVLLNRILGLPIFLLAMFAVFKLTFWVGDPLMGFIESGFDYLTGFIDGLWHPEGESPAKSLVIDGIIGGVGGVIVFLPNILLLFLGISFLEDSGYMARAAFLMDKVMKKIGLHGRSFIPMLIGFGCTIPAIMGTRILEDKKSRFTTIMVLPLMSCGARLPIYALIIPAFFAPQWHGFVMWLLYIIGIVLAVILASVLRKTILKGDTGIFLMELPPYRMPTLRGILTHMWQRSWLYLKKAGTLILALSIVLWALTSYPKPSASQISQAEDSQAHKSELEYSIAGRVGKAMEPVIKPMGFDYRIGTALIGALAAKEVFVAQMGIVYSLGDVDEESDTLREKLKKNYSSLQGFCVMLFCLISTPCVATLAVCRKETGSWKWAFFQYFGLTVIAYIITTIVYQIGSFIV